MNSAEAPSAISVRVPATSANLGPGFDALGLALGLYDDVTVSLRDDSEVVIEIEGLGADSLPRDEGHLLLKSLRTAAVGFDLALDGVEIRVRNAIPQGRGLGSSAATITAGVAAAWMLVPGHDVLDRRRVLAVAAALEGHPDNVAACVYGGLTISWQSRHGAAAATVQLHPDIGAELFLPTRELSTDTARGLLPAAVAHVDAAFNAGRAALLIHALSAGPDLLMEATTDRLHQQYRAAAIPESTQLLRQLRLAGIAAVISGAGPSVLALTSSDAGLGELPEVELPDGWTRQRVAVAAGVQASLVQGVWE